MAPRYGLLGGRLGHSLSPAIHQLFFQYAGKEGEYRLLEAEAAELPALFQELRSGYRGCNVTIPHKLAVLPLLDGVAGEAAAIGAVNTISFTPQGAYGYNTDYHGFRRLLAHYGFNPRGKVAAVLGSGGAARAVVKALADEGIGRLYLVSRQPQGLDPAFLTLAPQTVFTSYQELEGLAGDLLINCTPVGMYPAVAAAPVGPQVSARFAASVDLIYNPPLTRFLQQAQAAGRPCCNGLFMLVAQAVAAQELWQGESYPDSLVQRLMEALTA